MSQADFGLYIHIPWCVQKCPYCDFNSHVSPLQIPETAYCDALVNDFLNDLELNEISPQQQINSIFFGGGTPSLFSPQSIGTLLERISSHVNFTNNLEITLEANPGTTDESRFSGYKAAGINRLSLGVQSFDDHLLTKLGRIHDSEQAMSAFKKARKAGFENINLDLMFGLPDQTRETAIQDIQTAITLSPEHLSYYQLTLEPDTFFYRKPPALPSNDSIDHNHRYAQTLLESSGFCQYEVSAYSQPGYQCQHNLNYWKFGDYLGIGAGAHGKSTLPDGQIQRLWKIKNPARFIQYSTTLQRLDGKTLLTQNDLGIEFMMNALRLKQGFSENLFRETTGYPISLIDAAIEQGIQRQLLQRSKEKLVCTELGWQFLDETLQLFLG